MLNFHGYYELSPSKRPSFAQSASVVVTPIRTLVIDIGGTGIKALVVNEMGESVGQRVRVSTPQHRTPQAVIKAIQLLAKKAGHFHRVSVGFPGIIRNGSVSEAVNLGTAWEHFHHEGPP